MLKTMKSGRTWSYPINKKTRFKCEGYEGNYSIIDVATYDDAVHVLLEHNTWGDETEFLLAVLPSKCLRWYLVERNDGIQVKQFFILQSDILNAGWDSIEHLIFDAYDGSPELEDIEFWTDEEIDNMDGIKDGQ